MKVLFRVDAGHEVGLGHLMRCLALAQALSERNADIHFLVSPSTVPLCRKRHDWVGQVHQLPEDISKTNEVTYVTSFIQQNNVSIVVLDGYQFDETYHAGLFDSQAELVLFDDNTSEGELKCDVVINGASDDLADAYKHKAPLAALCVGEKFRVLRNEFNGLPFIPFEQRRSLTMIMGGSDPANMTLPLLSALEKHAFDGPVRVITGAAYPALVELNAFIHESPLTIQHLHDCQGMADVFLHSRLTVSAAGSSQFEMACAGSPGILLLLADNQSSATQTAASQGWAEMEDVRKGLEPDTLSTRILSLWRDSERLQHMSQLAYQNGDGEGAQRVVDVLHQRWTNKG